MVTIEKTTLPVWGNCVKLSNGNIELYATIDIGPRLIKLNTKGGKNFFCEDTEVTSTFSNEAHKKAFGGKEWRIFGGHRLWVSPENDPASYYPDSEPVAWQEISNGVILTPPPQRFTQLQMEMEVTMSDTEDSIKVTHRVTNQNAYAVEFAPWALSVMTQGGLEIVPQPKRQTGLLGNRVIALWPYSDMNDKRIYWGTDYITLQQIKEIEQPIKFGINNEDGWAAYFANNDLFIKTFQHDLNADYPDGGMSYETYTCPLMLEMESIGELKKVQPGETVSHDEVWYLFKDVAEPEHTEEAVHKILDPIIAKCK